MSEDSTGRIVSFTLDLDNPPELTAEERAQLEALGRMRDENIDFSDIPKQTDVKNWYRPGLYGAPSRRSQDEGVLVLEADVAALFEGLGEARTRKMNAVLREYGEAEQKRA